MFICNCIQSIFLGFIVKHILSCVEIEERYSKLLRMDLSLPKALKYLIQWSELYLCVCACVRDVQNSNFKRCDNKISNQAKPWTKAFLYQESTSSLFCVYFFSYWTYIFGLNSFSLYSFCPPVPFPPSSICMLNSNKTATSERQSRRTKSYHRTLDWISAY